MSAEQTFDFDLIVEGGVDENRNFLPHALHLTRLIWKGTMPPDVVVMPSGTLLAKVGNYAAPGNRYAYRVAVVAHLVNGQLQEPSKP